jgi:hypothetical protein
MDNPETLETLNTKQRTGVEKYKHNIENDEQHGPPKKPGVNPGAREG